MYIYNISNNYIATNHYVQLPRKDMDVNGHERLSNITLKTHNQVKEWRFYCCSAFQRHRSSTMTYA